MVIRKRYQYDSKNMGNQCLNTNELIGYALSNRLIVSCASIDGKTVVYHSYIFDDKNCRLLHSCSDFRTGDSSERNSIGRANKYLHWMDILSFKREGLIKYDWGGVASFEKPNGIDMFKEAFGGDRISYYNIYVPKTIRRKLYIIVVKKA